MQAAGGLPGLCLSALIVLPCEFAERVLVDYRTENTLARIVLLAPDEFHEQRLG